MDLETRKILKFILRTIAVILVLVIILIVFGVVQFIILTS
ncbi:hypothetical protein SAMN04488689_105397 [Paenibacillus sp. cl6col]|nr:hypothetical protein SAMN04488689_105397 [Paenibacillus sp. cl6col]